jgi:tetratricopeptide (TPR) repeat protein
VQLGLGRLALLRRQWAKAAEYLEISAGDEHARKQSLTLLAKVWTRLNKPEKAQAAQRQAEQAPEDVRWPDPFVAEVLRLRSGLRFRLEAAGALFGERNYSESIRLLQETVKRYPESTTARLQLGDTWQQLGRWTEAEHEFREAVRIDPEAGEAWFRLGCVQARNKSREAVESFRQAIRLKPDHALAHFNLAVRLRELGDSAGAVHEFRETLRCRPDYAPAREELRRWEKSKK